MSRKITKNELLEMLNSKITDLSENEILALINDELNKDNEQVDMDYVDACYELLEIKSDNSKITQQSLTGVRRIKRPVKILIAAAAICAVFIISITAIAQVNISIPEKIAHFINDNAEIDYRLENADTTADGYALSDTSVAKHLAEFGISPVTFPKEMINDSCEIKSIENLTIDKSLSIDAKIDFVYKNTNCSLYIYQYCDDFEGASVEGAHGVRFAEMKKINGMDVLIIEQDKSCFIKYKDNLTIYELFVFSDIETALDLAETIK